MPPCTGTFLSSRPSSVNKIHAPSGEKTGSDVNANRPADSVPRIGSASIASSSRKRSLPSAAMTTRRPSGEIASAWVRVTLNCTSGVNKEARKTPSDVGNVRRGMRAPTDPATSAPARNATRVQRLRSHPALRGAIGASRHFVAHITDVTAPGPGIFLQAAPLCSRRKTSKWSKA